MYFKFILKVNSWVSREYTHKIPVVFCSVVLLVRIVVSFIHLCWLGGNAEAELKEDSTSQQLSEQKKSIVNKVYV